jgi:hypothetical protein
MITISSSINKYVHTLFLLVFFFLSSFLHGLLTSVTAFACVSILALLVHVVHKRNKRPLQYSLLSITLLVGGLSFTTEMIQIVSAILLSLLVFTLLKSHIHTLKQSAADYFNTPISLQLLLIYGITLSIPLLSIPTQTGTFFTEFTHPIYGLSIGQSYKTLSLSIPDLSYSGKVISYHFFSVRLPLLFSTITNTTLLQSAFLITPLCLWALFLSVINLFKYLAPTKPFPWLTILFLPSFWVGSGGFTPLMSHFTMTTPAHSLAISLFMLCTISFLSNQFGLFLISFCLLTLTKASFSVVVVGALLLFFLRQSSNKLKLLKLIGFTILSFSVLFLLFLKGAHQHNLWLVFPGSLLRYLSLNLVMVIQIFTLLGISGRVLYKSKSTIEQWIGASVFSGVLGILLLFEITEWNHTQFGAAVSILQAILLVLLVNRLKTKWKTFYKGLGTILIAMGVFFYFETTVNTVKKAMVNQASYHTGNYVNNDLVSAYTWLGKQPTLGVVLFSKHYEGLSKGWFPKQSFIRSALSGKQLFSEHVKYKGVLMQPDYIERYAKNIFFYSTFVLPSELSKKELIKFKTSPVSDFEPYLSPYSLGKQWFFNNKFAQLKVTAPGLIKKEINSNSRLLEFLNQYNITYVVLEWGDMPGERLKQISETVYQSKTVTILKIK